jgi:hypothetical protein
MKVKLPMQSSFCPGHQPGHFFSRRVRSPAARGQAQFPHRLGVSEAERVTRFLNEPSRRVFRPLGRKDIEIEYRFIAEHLAPMGNIRGNDK